MGTSTDAILFYGYCWTEETSQPWMIGKEDEESDPDEDWEERWARAKGLTGPTEPFPNTRDARGKEIELPPEQAAIFDKFKEYWAEKRKLVEAAGCVVDTHCSGDCPMPLVAVKASLTRAWRGNPMEIASIEIDPAWKAMLDEFCATLGIPTEGQKATWWLVSDWS